MIIRQIFIEKNVDAVSIISLRKSSGEESKLSYTISAFGETPLVGIYLEYESARQRSPEPRLSEKRDLSAARFQEHL